MSADSFTTADVLAGYAAVLDRWITTSEAISCVELYRQVADLLPQSPSRIADIGAASGRDAAWLAKKGHYVTAIEPVAKFRQAGMLLHAGLGLDWRDGTLPSLSEAGTLEPFDCLLLTGVWQHLGRDDRSVAMRRLFELTAPRGRLVLSLRHGPGAAGRPVHQVQTEEEIAQARDCGFRLLRRSSADSLQPGNQAAGVTWTWLVFERP